MKLVNHFNSFLNDTVNLNRSRIDVLEARVDAIESFLQSSPTYGRIFRDLEQQGSWAHKTIIKPTSKSPAFDADVLLYVKKVRKWEPRDYVECLYQDFRSHGTYKGKVHRNPRCVTIDYEGEFHIDIVPTIVDEGLFILDDDQAYITNRLTNEFEPTNPSGYLEWFEKKNARTNGLLVQVIRLAKYLRDIKGVFSAKSILLTTLLADQVKAGLLRADNCDELYPDVPTALQTVFNRLNDYLQDNEEMPHVFNPSMPSEDFVRHWDEKKYLNFRNRIFYYTAKINAAMDANRDESIHLWRQVFGEEFAKGIAVPLIDKSRYDVPHRQAPPWDMRPGNTVIVKASAYKRQNSGYLGKLTNRSTTKLNKAIWIKFEATTNVSDYDAIEWQVVNTGGDASDDLRGGFYTSTDEYGIRWETTQYKGMHWVEAFVIKDNICLARSGAFEVNIA